VTLTAPPTAPDEDGARPVSPGDWRLLVVPTDGADKKSWPIDLFIHRDDSLPGYLSKGRQSRFRDDRYRVYDASGRRESSDQPDCHVLRSGTLNTFGYSRTAVVVGACYWDGRARGEPVDYSGVAIPARLPPDVTAPTEESRVLAGVIAAGTLSGSRIRLGGTSVAAPAVARALAALLAEPNKDRRDDMEPIIAKLLLPRPRAPDGEPKAFLPPLPRGRQPRRD
jgi:hypothetical protein